MKCVKAPLSDVSGAAGGGAWGGGEGAEEDAAAFGVLIVVGLEFPLVPLETSGISTSSGVAVCMPWISGSILIYTKLHLGIQLTFFERRQNKIFFNIRVGLVQGHANRDNVLCACQKNLPQSICQNQLP